MSFHERIRCCIPLDATEEAGKSCLLGTAETEEKIKKKPNASLHLRRCGGRNWKIVILAICPHEEWSSHVQLVY